MSNIRVIRQHQASFPQRLQRLHDTPKRLFLVGAELPTEDKLVLSVVGSRKASAYGRQVTAELIKGLADCNVVIVSGLALGIDSLAHRAALRHGLTTIAILPSGLDTVYPASHRQLARSIIDRNGSLVSEYPAGTRAAKYHFPARNRIIAALADAVLVVEAAERSGSLITAEHALDLGVNVLAVPGGITSPQSAGTNRLIQLGAGLIDSADALRSELGLARRAENKKVVVGSPQEQAVVDCLRNGALSASDLCKRTNIEARELNRLLTSLELAGSITSQGGNVWSL